MEKTLHYVPAASRLAVASKCPQGSKVGSLGDPLEVAVVFTDPQSTLVALKAAAIFAENLNIGIRLIVPQVVSYAAPLEMPPVPPRIVEERLLALASRTWIDTRVEIYVCRNEAGTLLRVLKPHSVVMIGGRRRWWPCREKRLARALRRAGHEVIIPKSE